MDNRGTILKLIRDSDFTLVRSKKHQIWKCPCGHHQMVTSGSRHEGRGDRNTRARLAKILRECRTCTKCRNEERAA